MAKTLYMLIGPKGAGKTYIGALVEKATDITFLRVEPIWLALDAGEDGWARVEAAIDAAFADCRRLMIESLGTGREFHRLLASLETRYTVRMVRMRADPEICLERVRRRRRQDHIPLSDAQVRAYNRIAARVSFDWAFEIDNNGPASDEAILSAVRRGL